MSPSPGGQPMSYPLASNSQSFYVPNVHQGLPTLIVMIVVLVIIILFCFWGAPAVRSFCKQKICCFCPMDEPNMDQGFTTPATPTIILLPFGRMLVVDRRIFSQLQADYSGIDFMELSANLIRNQRYIGGSSVSELDSDSASKIRSTASLDCYPPSYEDIFGPKHCDLPPSYSEVSMILKNSKDNENNNEVVISVTSNREEFLNNYRKRFLWKSLDALKESLQNLYNKNQVVNIVSSRSLNDIVRNTKLINRSLELAQCYPLGRSNTTINITNCKSEQVEESAGSSTSKSSVEIVNEKQRDLLVGNDPSASSSKFSRQRDNFNDFSMKDLPSAIVVLNEEHKNYQHESRVSNCNYLREKNTEDPSVKETVSSEKEGSVTKTVSRKELNKRILEQMSSMEEMKGEDDAFKHSLNNESKSSNTRNKRDAKCTEPSKRKKNGAKRFQKTSGSSEISAAPSSNSGSSFMRAEDQRLQHVVPNTGIEEITERETCL